MSRSPNREKGPRICPDAPIRFLSVAGKTLDAGIAVLRDALVERQESTAAEGWAQLHGDLSAEVEAPRPGITPRSGHRLLCHVGCTHLLYSQMVKAT